MIVLRELLIANIRGVRSHALTLKGSSLVIVGPNGSGKSSVVDALDFLLTGSVRRLEGQGAGGLSVADHGKHVDAPAKEAWVEGVFAVGELQKVPVRVRRSLSGELTPAVLPPDLALEFERARRLRHHVLSRREILKFVLAAPGARGEQVASLIETNGVDEQRREITGARKDADADLASARTALRQAEESLVSAFSPRAANLVDALQRVNALRAVLGGAPLQTLASSELLAGLPPVVGAMADPLRASEGSLKQILDEVAAAELGAAIRALLTAMDAARSAGARNAHQQQQLLGAALEIAEGHHCPLCGTEVALTDLRKQWSDRLSANERATQEVEALRATRQGCSTVLQSLAREIGTVCKALGPRPAAAALREIADALAAAARLPDPVDGDLAYDLSALEGSLARLQAELSALLEAAGQLPAPDADAKAWADLQAVATSVSRFEQCANAIKPLEVTARFLAAAEAAFIGARDAVLGGIYADIAGRAEALYAKIHKETGQPRKTTLSSTKAGLALEVDFHGRGAYPPSALHSEGQQDTLGICLFLALAERACEGPPPLLILDDVLMSVDAEHRRATAELLRSEFSKTQLVITTHDEVWARQLKNLGVVAATLRFDEWSIEGARETAPPATAFERMRVDVGQGRIPTAAHSLRRTLETILPDICEALGARVRFRQNGRYDMGDFLGAAKGRYADLIKEGIKAKGEWKQDPSALLERQKRFAEAVKQLGAEEATVNRAVHYNADEILTAADLIPAIEAYESFVKFFECETCKSLLHLEEGTTRAVRCRCGDASWSLPAK